MMVATPARAGSTPYEVSLTTGLGAMSFGVTPGRFALAPGVSFTTDAKDWHFRAQETIAILGINAGPWGVVSTTTAGAGHSWESANLDFGLSLAAYSTEVCGPALCGRMSGIAPGADLRFDYFAEQANSLLGVSLTAKAIWISGEADGTWTGVSLSFTVGPVFRINP